MSQPHRAAWLLAFFLTLPATAFDLQGHRGARGLAPENTLAGFQRALAIGVTTLETDVGVTLDEVLVIAHDPYVNANFARAPDGAWLASRGPSIRTLTLAELERYDIGRMKPGSAYARQFPEQQSVDGQRYPTLAKLFAQVRDSGKPVRLNLETKITPDGGDATPPPETFARLLVEAVQRAGMAQRTTIQSFDWRTLIEARRLAPQIPTSCLTMEGTDFDTVRRRDSAPSPWHAGLDLREHGGSLPRLVKAAGCSTWSMYWRNVTREDIVAAHALGLTVLPWTVNDPADMNRLIDMGVDGIITDYPDRLRAVMTQRAMTLP